ncbi:MAG: chorismate mutase [Sphaerochaetaceae bacterium]|nr:chorismate mutase [Sphaerochaetaceae bacterium]
MNELEEARATITKVDEQMAKLFEERMEACRKVAKYKMENGLSIRDPERERVITTRNVDYLSNKELEPYYVDFLKNNINLACAFQSKLMEGMKIGYCGVEGAYAHIATKELFPYGNYVAYSSFEGAYKGCEKGEVDAVVLPIV